MNLMEHHVKELEKRLRTASAKWQADLPMLRVMTEWEVVFLLGLLAHDANLKLLAGSDVFPDAILQFDDETGTHEIRTELEYAASNFNHDPNRCDLIICWLKDASMRQGIPVIGLKNFFPNLASVGTATLHLIGLPKGISQLVEKFDKWLRGFGLEPFDQVPKQASTNSLRYHLSIQSKGMFKSKDMSLCAVQYMPLGAPSYVELRYQRKTLESLSVLPAMEECWPKLLRLSEQQGFSAKRTDRSGEFKIACAPEADKAPSYIVRLMEILDPLMQQISFKLQELQPR